MLSTWKAVHVQGYQHHQFFLVSASFGSGEGQA